MTSDPLSWETLDRHVAYTCPGFDVVNQAVRLPDGTETDFDYVSEPPSVAILPFTPDGTVVCIEEWRQAVDRVNQGIPVGSVERDDVDPEQAARRELAEETGYEAETLDPLVSVEPANGFADSIMHFFVAHGCRPTAEQRLDHDESIRVRLRSREAFEAAVDAGEIRDGRAVLAVSYYGLFSDDGAPDDA